jgi:hypothetical protein
LARHLDSVAKQAGGRETVGQFDTLQMTFPRQTPDERREGRPVKGLIAVAWLFPSVAVANGSFAFAIGSERRSRFRIEYNVTWEL